jgi:hypothetical protein
MKPLQPRRLVVLTVASALVAVACAGQRGQVRTEGAGDEAWLKKIAESLAQASPPADGSDAAARDAAAARLAECDALLERAGDRILWGGFDPTKGFDLDAYALTEFVPWVWNKVYLSTFTFPGTYTVRREGRYTVLELDARFRDGLDPGDYPYPFWHSPKKWQAYVATDRLQLVFEKGRLVAAMRTVPAGGPAATVAERPWDGRWNWTDAHGNPQPRVTLFEYMFSRENPNVTALDGAYRRLESEFRAQNCVACHAPDNPSSAKVLLLLDYPNQALAARHSLVETLRANKMPPPDAETGHEAGIADEPARQRLIGLAEEFVSAADRAMAFEKAR